MATDDGAHRKQMWRRAYLASRSARRTVRGRGSRAATSNDETTTQAETYRRLACRDLRWGGEVTRSISSLVGLAPADTTIAAYQPLPSEVDVGPIVRSWSDAGGQVIVPTADAMSRRRHSEPRWRHLERQGGSPLGSHRAPPLLADAQAILVPGLVFGRDGRRLGRGAGWYDRALRRASIGVPIIGVAFDTDVVEGGLIPVDTHDRPVDYLLTPTTLMQIER